MYGTLKLAPEETVSQHYKWADLKVHYFLGYLSSIEKGGSNNEATLRRGGMFIYPFLIIDCFG